MDTDYHRPVKRSRISHETEARYYAPQTPPSHPHHHQHPLTPAPSTATAQFYRHDLTSPLEPFTPLPLPTQDGNFWVDSSLYALDPLPAFSPTVPRDGDWVLTQESAEQASTASGDPTIHSWLAEQIPSLFTARLPRLEERVVDPAIVNPYEDDTEERFSDLVRRKKVVPVDGAINSYIKFRIRHSDHAAPEEPRIGHRRRLSSSSDSSQMSNSSLPSNVVPYLPPNFGKKWNLDEMDKKLMRFCELLPPPKDFRLT